MLSPNFSPRRSSSSGAIILVCVIVAAAGLLRLKAAEGDLWLDEIWSLDNLAVAMTRLSLIDRLPLLFHDNTHPLNTLYLAMVGPQAGAFAYRALAIGAGTAAVAMAAAMGWRRSRRDGLIAAGLIASSYPMIHFSSEARGYALLLLAALASFHLMEAYLRAPSRRRLAAFILVSLLGLASHLTFLMVEAALAAWAAMMLYRRFGSIISTLARLILLFGVQFLVLEAFAAVAWNNMVIGGSPAASAAASATVMVQLGFGVDALAGGSNWLALAVVSVATTMIWRLYREGDTSWIFYLLMILGFPLALIAIDIPVMVLPRYFLVNALFVLVISARGLGLLIDRGPWGRVAAGLALILFLFANSQLLDKFFTAGRGHFAEALRSIAAATDGPVRVAGYHEFSIGTLLKYYARAEGLENAVGFVPAGEDALNPAEWFIDGHFTGGKQAKPVIFRRKGGSGATAYKLVAVYPHWGMSGDTWAVYRRGG